MPNCNIWNIITIIVALDLLYDDFKTTITNILEPNNKTVKKI